MQTTALNELMKEYVSLRRRGLTSNEVLDHLRWQIEALGPQIRGQIVATVEYAERKLAEKNAQQRARTQNDNLRIYKPDDNERTVHTPHPCEVCGTFNRNGEFYCHHCGNPMLEIVKPSSMSTRRLPRTHLPSDEQFTPGSKLVMLLPGQQQSLVLRPQASVRDLIFGREDAASGICPDVDLTHMNGADLGVSRLHMSLRYDARHNRLLVRDMGSANGVAINEQELGPTEERVLRHGDHIRLGELTLRVAFARD